uniref:Uncharacterized protein n=1 Tax=Anopheles culicifacies TaxID=139723 RepID=A0A182M1W7_9DIPT
MSIQRIVRIPDLYHRQLQGGYKLNFVGITYKDTMKKPKKSRKSRPKVPKVILSQPSVTTTNTTAANVSELTEHVKVHQLNLERLLKAKEKVQENVNKTKQLLEMYKAEATQIGCDTKRRDRSSHDKPSVTTANSIEANISALDKQMKASQLEIEQQIKTTQRERKNVNKTKQLLMMYKEQSEQSETTEIGCVNVIARSAIPGGRDKVEESKPMQQHGLQKPQQCAAAIVGLLIQEQPRKQKKARRPKPDVLELVPHTGKNMFDLHRKLRHAIEQEGEKDLDDQIGRYGKMAWPSNVRLPLSRTADTDVVRERVQRILVDEATVRVVTKMGEIIVSDIDPVTTAEELKAALDEIINAYCKKNADDEESVEPKLFQRN